MLKKYLFVVLLLFTACETLNKRIEKNLDYMITLPPEIQNKIKAGQIDLGFEPRMVAIAWGRATDKTYSKDMHGETESWIYTTTHSDTHYRDARVYDETEKKWKTIQESYTVTYEYATRYVIFTSGKVIKFGTYPSGTLFNGPGSIGPLY